MQSINDGVNITIVLVNSPAIAAQLSLQWQAFSYALFTGHTLLPAVDAALDAEGGPGLELCKFAHA